MFDSSIDLTITPPPRPGVQLLEQNLSPMVSRGHISLAAERHHISLLVYAIPRERISAVIPGSFEVEETVVNGRVAGWISVESFFDWNGMASASFEQTNYRAHVLRQGVPCHFLLGTSLGSLSGAGARNLWPMPWHLSAMEFRVAYDHKEGRYRTYRLQTQSQWANANWELEDSGELISSREIAALPASLQSSTVTNYFLRRDGHQGQQQMRAFDRSFTRGALKVAKCDLLERLGLLDGKEITHPQLVALQHNLSCQFGAPSAVGAIPNKQFPLAA